MTSSKNTLLSAALALTTMAGASAGALAGGDVIYTGVKQAGSAAVPVPAPVPVPTVASGFYVRLDAAYSQGDTNKYKSTDPYVDQFRGDSYLNNFPRYGFGLGYYFNRYLRADITFDQRNDVTSRGTGVRNYTIPNTAGGLPLPAPPSPANIAMRDTYSDGFTSSNSTGLLNLYADLPMSNRFTPYVGAGIGYVRHQLKGRNFSRTTTCVDGTDCDPTAIGNQGTSTVNSFASTTAGGVDYTLATALMAGFSFQVWDNTKIDIGYRWLHLAGTTFVGRNTAIVENLKIPDQNIHELRAGVRFDIN